MELSCYEQMVAKNAHHRALILRILLDHPDGLTTQRIIEAEKDYYGYTFLTDNRLRELRKIQLVQSIKDKDGVIRWVKTNVEQSP